METILQLQFLKSLFPHSYSTQNLKKFNRLQNILPNLYQITENNSLYLYRNILLMNGAQFRIIREKPWSRPETIVFAAQKNEPDPLMLKSNPQNFPNTHQTGLP